MRPRLALFAVAACLTGPAASALADGSGTLIASVAPATSIRIDSAGEMSGAGSTVPVRVSRDRLGDTEYITITPR